LKTGGQGRTHHEGRHDWRIEGKLGVLINAGGFAHNQEMRDKYIPGTSTKWTASIREIP